MFLSTPHPNVARIKVEKENLLKTATKGAFQAKSAFQSGLKNSETVSKGLKDITNSKKPMSSFKTGYKATPKNHIMSATRSKNISVAKLTVHVDDHTLPSTTQDSSEQQESTEFEISDIEYCPPPVEPLPLGCEVVENVQVLMPQMIDLFVTKVSGDFEVRHEGSPHLGIDKELLCDEIPCLNLEITPVLL